MNNNSNLRIGRLFKPLAISVLVFLTLLLFTSLSFAQQNTDKVQYYCPGENREVTIYLNVNRPGIIAGSMWVKVDNIVTSSYETNNLEWHQQLIEARKHLSEKLSFLADNGFTEIDVQFPDMQQHHHKSNMGYERVIFSFPKHVRGVWEISVPQDMETLNIGIIASGKAKMRSAQAGKSLTLII